MGSTEVVRLYHLARQWELSPAALVHLLRSGGLEVENHFMTVEQDAMQELEAAAARGREAMAADEAARAEAAAEAAVAQDPVLSERTDPIPEVAVAEEPPVAQDVPEKKRKRKRRRNKKSKEAEETDRPRSIYGSGRLTWKESAPAAQESRPSKERITTSMPSFGKKKEASSPTPATSAAAPVPATPSPRAATPPAQEASRTSESPPQGSVPAFKQRAAAEHTPPSPPVAEPAPPAVTPDEPVAPARAASTESESAIADSPSRLPLLVVGLVVIVLGVLVFVISQT